MDGLATDRKLRAILVEDREADARLVLHALKTAGYDVDARVVDTADAFTSALADPPDIVLADYNLPGFNAFDTIARLKASGVDVPLIVVSGTIGEDVAVAAIRAGAHDYLIKDRLARLGAAVNRALEERASRDREEAAAVALRQSEARLRAILDNVGEGIVTCDESGLVDSVNRAALELFGFTADELTGRSIEMVIADDRRADFLGYLTTSPAQQRRDAPYAVDTTGRRKDGSPLPLEFSAEGVQLDDRRLIIVSFRDVSERRAYMEALEYQALHDALTGLPNRVLFGDRVSQAVAAAERSRSGFGVLLLDLDRFKDVNDTLGHEQGDALLRAFAARLKETLREVDTVARLGGDEFGILPQGIADEEGLMQTARKILTTMQEPFVLEGQVVDTPLSVGIARFPVHGSDVNTLVRHADVAMYVAKHRGLGCAMYDPEQDRNAAHRLALLGQLRRAISHDELFLHFQPQVDLAQRHVRAVEALVRWQHPEQGLLMPDQFLPLAEQSDLMAPLTSWVLDRALGQLATWRRHGLDLVMSVNATTRNLQDHEFPAIVGDVLRKHDLAADLLTIEITESSAMSPLAIDGLEPLHRAGVTLSIDDFGTGYSSLAYLKRLPVAQIKIDKSFIMDLSHDEDDAAIVRPTIALGHNLGLEVVAEGVEDEEALRMLATYGCDFIQGHLVSRAVDAATFEAWLSAGRWRVQRMSARQRIAW